MLRRMIEERVEKGSARSGNWGHRGRPGQRGGSLPGGGHSFFGLMEDAPRSTLDAYIEQRRAEMAKPAKKQPPPGGTELPTEEGEDKRVAVEAEMYRTASYTNEQMGGGDIDDLTTVGYAVRGSVKDRLVRDVSEQSGQDYDTVNNTVKQWSYSSNDEDMRSLAIQRDAAAEFGIPLSEYTQGKIEYTQREFGAYLSGKPLYDSATQQSVLRGMYENTQASFREQGIAADAKITLYRGVVFEGQKGYWKKGEAFNFEGNALESWTTDKNIAARFASGAGMKDTGVVMKADVPASSILSTCLTGFGCLTEAEVVVVGGKGEAVAFDIIEPGSMF